jgi:RHS repeat-associated protein
MAGSSPLRSAWLRLNHRYTYDANGNTLSNASGKSYTWDFENRLVQAVVPGTNGGTTTFKYDPFGRRIQKSGPLGTTNYLYDGLGAGANVIEEVDSSGNVLVRYAQGLGTDQPLSMLRTGTTSYYNADALGSITSLSNSSATIANTYTYDSFGKLAASTGTLTNSFQYTAREFDPETGIYEYRARYFDQNSGRFLSEDPIRENNGPNQSAMDDSANLYVYVLNNAVNYVDPSGLYILKPGIPPPTGALAALLTCAEDCLGSILTITSTSEPIPQHPRNSPHGRGEAADMRSPSNVSKLLCCLSQCGAGFALDEAAHPSAHATGPHVHAQTGPGRNGGRGDLPPAKKGKDCQ